MEEAFSFDGRTLRKGRMVGIGECSFSGEFRSLHAFLFYAIMGCMSIGSGGKSGKRIGKAPVIVREVFQNFSL